MMLSFPSKSRKSKRDKRDKSAFIILITFILCSLYIINAVNTFFRYTQINKPFSLTWIKMAFIPNYAIEYCRYTPLQTIIPAEEKNIFLGSANFDYLRFNLHPRGMIHLTWGLSINPNLKLSLVNIRKEPRYHKARFFIVENSLPNFELLNKEIELSEKSDGWKKRFFYPDSYTLWEKVR
ncbi:MAG: hypothetical protein HQK51_15590 [Oligoflexia bacterium]|nr:hypothetical protein [Oligoflexia bacterium]